MSESRSKSGFTDLKSRKVDSSAVNLTGVNVLIVGGTGGLGQAISRFMASKGANIWVVGQTFRDSDVPNIKFIKADLSSMREAKRIGREIPSEELDLCIFTTGIIAAPTRQETSEGIERDMAVSYLSRLVILREIGSRLGIHRDTSGIKPRVFVMGFPGSGQPGNIEDLNAENSYSPMAVHMNTVAGNEMLVVDGVARFPNIRIFGLNPGLIKTNIRNNYLGAGSMTSRVTEYLISLFTPTPETYAQMITPLLVGSELEDMNGTMFDQKGRDKATTQGLSKERVRSFLEASQDLLNRKVGLSDIGIAFST